MDVHFDDYISEGIGMLEISMIGSILVANVKSSHLQFQKNMKMSSKFQGGIFRMFLTLNCNSADSRIFFHSPCICTETCFQKTSMQGPLWSW